MTALD